MAVSHIINLHFRILTDEKVNMQVKSAYGMRYYSDKHSCFFLILLNIVLNILHSDHIWEGNICKQQDNIQFH